MATVTRLSKMRLVSWINWADRVRWIRVGLHPLIKTTWYCCIRLEGDPQIQMWWILMRADTGPLPSWALLQLTHPNTKRTKLVVVGAISHPPNITRESQILSNRLSPFLLRPLWIQIYNTPTYLLRSIITFKCNSTIKSSTNSWKW